MAISAVDAAASGLHREEAGRRLARLGRRAGRARLRGIGGTPERDREDDVGEQVEHAAERRPPRRHRRVRGERLHRLERALEAALLLLLLFLPLVAVGARLLPFALACLLRASLRLRAPRHLLLGPRQHLEPEHRQHRREHGAAAADAEEKEPPPADGRIDDAAPLRAVEEHLERGRARRVASGWR